MLSVPVSVLKSWLDMIKKLLVSMLVIFVSCHILAEEDAKKSPYSMVETASSEGENSTSLSAQSGHLLEVAAALFFVLMVILLLAWLSKRLGGPYVGKNHVLMIKAALPLSAKEKLMIVQIGEEQVVIGVAPGFVGHIKTLDVPLVTNDSAMPINLSKASFSQTLRSILTRNIATHAEKNV